MSRHPKNAFPLTSAEAERSLTSYVWSWVVYDPTAVIAMEAIRGLQQYHISNWDSLIWATAKINHVSNVLSEDFGDGVLIEGVRFLNPFTKDFRIKSL